MKKTINDRLTRFPRGAASFRTAKLKMALATTGNYSSSSTHSALGSDPSVMQTFQTNSLFVRSKGEPAVAAFALI